jgi:glycosyltransferase involved in cell wall biosynthesis
MPKIAIVHDYFTQRGGAERVAEQLYAMLPGADIYSTVALPKMIPAAVPAEKIRTSWMQSLPKMEKYHRYYFAMYPLGVKALDLTEYDVVITSSSGYAKGVRTRPDAFHICYCHTPMRWVWRYSDYAERESFGKGARAVLPVVLKALRAWDRNAARQPDQFIANSTIVAERIASIYDRHAVVIPPPIDVNRFHISSHQEDYFLVLSRLVAYKRIDLAIAACNSLQRNLTIIGDGPDRKRLEEMAGPTVQFLGRLPDEMIQEYVGGCQALLFPGEEDFGMVPLEVASAGRPTIAFRGGGATETIIDKVTGLFFDKPEVGSLLAALEEFPRYTWSPSLLRNHAAQFDIEVFRERILGLLASLGITLEPSDFAVAQPSFDSHTMSSRNLA